MNAGKHRRKKIVFAVLAAVLAAHLLHAVTLDRMVQYVEEIYGSPKINGELAGYRIAFITDTHAMADEEMEKIAEELNRRKVDLLLLGGDHANGAGAYRTMGILSSVQARDGIFGVDGNHDDFAELSRAMRQNGITLLDNMGQRLRPGLYIAGVQDLWNRAPDMAQAVRGAGGDDFVLMVCHNPDASMQQNTEGIDLMLSGHTHGGQITLFGVFAPVLVFLDMVSEYGQRFMTGWCKNDSVLDIYVSNGVGSSRYGPRVFARPQVVIITLEAQ